jgi:hypothetical protein
MFVLRKLRDKPIFEMLKRIQIIAAVLALGAVTLVSTVYAADLPADLPVKAVPFVDTPFFAVNDNRLTYAYIFSGTDPGTFSTRPDGSVNGTTPKSVYNYTHFDAWAYGTNFLTISMYKSDHNDPTAPCTNSFSIYNPGTGTSAAANCAGATEVYGLIRSTFGFNEIFNTKAFSYGILRNVSFEIGADVGAENDLYASAKRDVVAGLQFAFDLPYKGYVDVAPLFYKETNHNGFLQCGAGFVANNPGLTCLESGSLDYKPTWALETNYYMNLGFLPESIQFFSISGRAGWIGKKGNENAPLNTGVQTAVELNSEPIRLTFDASKAMWGAKYSHFLDVWVAYRYWQNKFGLDHAASSNCLLPSGASNNTCTESSLYSGVTVKF